MKPNEVNEEIIGKRCKCIFTGMMVTGTITEINVNKYTADVKVRFDEPHNWGGELYEYDWSFGRFCDDFGSLRHLQIIDDLYKTIKVTFPQHIREIDKMFIRNHSNGQTVNLKEWIDSYESTRFTQITERTAIITSEYNMEHAKEWIEKNIPESKIEVII